MLKSKNILIKESSDYLIFIKWKIIMNHIISIIIITNILFKNMMLDDHFVYLILKLCISAQWYWNWLTNFELFENVKMMKVFTEKAVKIRFENQIYYIIIKNYYVLCETEISEFDKWILKNIKNMSASNYFKIIFERMIISLNLCQEQSCDLLCLYIDFNEIKNREKNMFKLIIHS